MSILRILIFISSKYLYKYTQKNTDILKHIDLIWAKKHVLTNIIRLKPKSQAIYIVGVERVHNHYLGDPHSKTRPENPYSRVEKVGKSDGNFYIYKIQICTYLQSICQFKVHLIKARQDWTIIHFFCIFLLTTGNVTH